MGIYEDVYGRSTEEQQKALADWLETLDPLDPPLDEQTIQEQYDLLQEQCDLLHDWVAENWPSESFDLSRIIYVNPPDQEKLERVQRLFHSGKRIPPIVVTPEGDTGQYCLTDGHRRVYEAQRRGITELEAVDLRKGGGDG